MKTNKKIYEEREAFRLLLEKELKSEVMGRARQRHISMTAYITKAIVEWIKYERKFDEKK